MVKFRIMWSSMSISVILSSRELRLRRRHMRCCHILFNFPKSTENVHLTTPHTGILYQLISLVEIIVITHSFNEEKYRTQQCYYKLVQKENEIK